MVRFVFAVSVILLSLGCTRSKFNFSEKTVLDVNGSKLTAGHFADKMIVLLKDQDALGAKDPKTVNLVKKKIVNDFITKSLAEDYARANSIIVKAEELEGEITKIQRNYPDDFAFREALAEQNLTFKKWRDELHDTLLQKKIEGDLFKTVKHPTEAEVQSYYYKNKETFTSVEMAEIQQVLVATESDAKRIEQELKKGKRLSDLAKEFSISPEGPSGGKVGWIEKGSSDVFEAAFHMKPGTRSPIVKSAFGYHIFLVSGRKPTRTLSFKEAQPKIQRILLENSQSSTYLAWLESQLRKARVFKDQELIDGLIVETKGE